MPLVIITPRLSIIQSLGFSNTIPDRMRPFDPCLVINIGIDGCGILSRLAKDHDIIRERRTRPR